MKKGIIATLFILCLHAVYAQTLEPIRRFGQNPGRLKMYLYSPPTIRSGTAAPLVVVLHGCTQTARIVARQTDWNKLAAQYGFRVLYPQQRMINNPCRCFNWYNPKDIDKDNGEDYSIRQMIDYATEHYGVDTAQIYITGLSAGGAMGVAMMADYPQLFRAGAIYAGGAYKLATNPFIAMAAMEGWVLRSPSHLGDLVRAQNPGYTGSYPRMIVYQGRADLVVNRRNGMEIVKQWTDLLHISEHPTETIRRYTQVRSLERNTFRDAAGREQVIYYRIRHMGHALPVYPGHCDTRGGHMLPFSANKKFFSTYRTAVDFGLIKEDSISGPVHIHTGQQVIYSVSADAKNSYHWHYPKDCKIIGDPDSPSISLIWGSKTGNLDLTVISADGCQKNYPTRLITVSER